jgi:hypothetical protein
MEGFMDIKQALIQAIFSKEISEREVGLRLYA